MTRRKGRKPTFQIRMDIDTKKELDSLRGDYSYNQYIYHYLLGDKKLLDKYRLVTEVLSKIEKVDLSFFWACDKLGEYVEQERG